MEENSASDDNDVLEDIDNYVNSDDDEIDKYGNTDDEIDKYGNTDDEIDNFLSSPCSSPLHSTSGVRPVGTNLVVMFTDMGFPYELVVRAIEETKGASAEPGLILECLVKLSATSEASSSKSKLIDQLIDMGFPEELVIKAIHQYGEENGDEITKALLSYGATSEASSSKSKLIDQLIDMGFSEELVIKAIHQYGEENFDEITNALLCYREAEMLHETVDEDINMSSDDNEDDDDLFSGLFSSDEENDLPSSHGDKLQALIKMDYPREEASLALERCGENASLADVVDFIGAAQMARQFEEFYAGPNEEEPSTNSRKRRAYNEPPKRRSPITATASDYELIRLPRPMIGFGVPNEPGLMSQRPVPIPDIASGPPYFYYENVAMAPKGVWATISRNLYSIMPEFVDSLYICAAARKRGYIHNLPIKGRFQIQPPPHYTIHEAFPSMKSWWPSWDRRTKLNCLLTCIASAKITNRIRVELEKYDGEPPEHVQTAVMKQCKKWNLVWVGKNRTAPLDPVEMEKLLGFPEHHTRGCITSTDRYKCLGNSFQVDTVAYHLSVLKSIFPRGINVLSLFTGIGGGEVAIHRLQIPMKLVVSVEISEVNQSVFRNFWEQENQRGKLMGKLIEFRDVRELNKKMIEELMDRYGAFDLVIGGSPCNNLTGSNRYTRTGLEGEQSSLFYEYCRILNDVRSKAARMRR